ncbi:hypothetical protein DRP07_08785 [Archaeoglobales archaeon]|nr:MAG: hypothetical protein DRP07_08785 [Archaeoglobales archaeon]
MWDPILIQIYSSLSVWILNFLSFKVEFPYVSAERGEEVEVSVYCQYESYEYDKQNYTKNPGFVHKNNPILHGYKTYDVENQKSLLHMLIFSLQDVFPFPINFKYSLLGCKSLWQKTQRMS